jgi:hypothetical protein
MEAVDEAAGDDGEDTAPSDDPSGPDEVDVTAAPGDGSAGVDKVGVTAAPGDGLVGAGEDGWDAALGDGGVGAAHGEADVFFFLPDKTINKVKDVRAKLPLQKFLFPPRQRRQKISLMRADNYPVGNPKRKV